MKYCCNRNDHVFSHGKCSECGERKSQNSSKLRECSVGAWQKRELREMHMNKAWLWRFRGSKYYTKAVNGILDLRICHFFSVWAEDSALTNKKPIPIKGSQIFQMHDYGVITNDHVTCKVELARAYNTNKFCCAIQMLDLRNWSWPNLFEHGR